jgi:hypothetical protein
MRTSIWLITLALAAALSPTAAKADTTYAVHETVGVGSATGFITTNGTIGTLDIADILDWNLTLNDGTHPPVDLEGPASGNNSLALLVGSDLTATPTQLLFAFGAADEEGSSSMSLRAPSFATTPSSIARHAGGRIAGHANSRHRLRLHSVVGYPGNSRSCPDSRAEHCRPVSSRPRPAPPDEKTTCRAIPRDDHVSKVRFAPAISKRDSW